MPRQWTLMTKKRKKRICFSPDIIIHCCVVLAGNLPVLVHADFFYATAGLIRYTAANPTTQYSALKNEEPRSNLIWKRAWMSLSFKCTNPVFKTSSFAQCLEGRRPFVPKGTSTYSYRVSQLFSALHKTKTLYIVVWTFFDWTTVYFVARKKSRSNCRFNYTPDKGVGVMKSHKGIFMDPQKLCISTGKFLSGLGLEALQFTRAFNVDINIQRSSQNNKGKKISWVFKLWKEMNAWIRYRGHSEIIASNT